MRKHERAGQNARAEKELPFHGGQRARMQAEHRRSTTKRQVMNGSRPLTWHAYYVVVAVALYCYKYVPSQRERRPARVSGDVHGSQRLAPSRIVMKAGQPGVRLEEDHQAPTLVQRAIQPVEGVVDLAEYSVKQDLTWM